jgi:ABC-type phosphate/phosphonate transport system ATPase subunit
MDINTIAFNTVKKATTKNPAAVALGRMGGLKGGRARADKLSSKQRISIARKAASTRWSKKS